MFKLVQISDLHVECEWYDKKLGDNLIRLVNRESPDLLVVAGDLTDYGYLPEYERALRYLQNFEAKHTLVVPGNHDMRNEGYVLFEEFFGTRHPTFENELIAVLGLDSTQPDLQEGHIGRQGYEVMKSFFSKINDKLKIVVLHHHVISIPGTGREIDILLDAGDFMVAVKELGINMVLTGHRHKAWTWKVDGTYYITSGTATTRRLKGRDHPSFNVYEIYSKEEVLMRRISTETGEILEERELRFNVKQNP